MRSKGVTRPFVGLLRNRLARNLVRRTGNGSWYLASENHLALVFEEGFSTGNAFPSHSPKPPVRLNTFLNPCAASTLAAIDDRPPPWQCTTIGLLRGISVKLSARLPRGT